MMFFVITENDESKRNQVIEAIKVMGIKKPISVEIKEFRKNRTLSQNRLMWSWINILADHIGETSEDLHEMLKQRFLGIVQKKIMGEECTISRSTTKLNTTEFRSYLELIEDIASKLQVRLPRPDDYNFAMYGEVK